MERKITTEEGKITERMSGKAISNYIINYLKNPIILVSLVLTYRV